LLLPTLLKLGAKKKEAKLLSPVSLMSLIGGRSETMTTQRTLCLNSRLKISLDKKALLAMVAMAAMAAMVAMVAMAAMAAMVAMEAMAAMAAMVAMAVAMVAMVAMAAMAVAMVAMVAMAVAIAELLDLLVPVAFAVTLEVSATKVLEVL